MKKFVSILLALTLVFNLGIVAFATENTSLTITDEGDREYVGYQLLNLTTSLKTGEHHPEHEGDHNNDCYNYAYTVNAKYRAVFQQEVYDNGGNYLWEQNGKPASASLITDAQILEYLANQKSDNGDVYHTMRQVADRLYRSILAANIQPDATDLDGENDNIAQGYWMIADVTALDGNESNSLVMVDTKGQDALTVTSKTALPTVEKKVKDIDDSEDDNIADNGWHDSADHDIGDTIPFKLTATLPSNIRAYIVRAADGSNSHDYSLIFHDTLSAGLTLKPGTFKVYMYETLYKANVDTDLNDYIADVTAYFTTVTTGLETGCSFEVRCQDVIDIGFIDSETGYDPAIPSVTSDTAFVVYYEATLNGNAVVGGAGNPNEVYLEFSNEPYGDGTGKTETDKVTVFTYQMVINKTDAHGHALAGAGFKLYKKNLAGEYVQLGNELKGDEMTTFTWTGLDDGDYKLEESTVPEGFNKMSDILFSISAVHDELAAEPELRSLDGGLMGVGSADTGTIEKDIVNNTGTILPETGAEGTILLISLSTMLVIVAAVFMITRKKMSIYED